MDRHTTGSWCHNIYKSEELDTGLTTLLSGAYSLRSHVDDVQLRRPCALGALRSRALVP